MARAIWNGVLLAESNATIIVEGNHYFPPTAINRQYVTENNTHTVCHWKGVASYYDVIVDGKVNGGATWYYPEPKAATRQIKDYVAFWRDVQVLV